MKINKEEGYIYRGLREIGLSKKFSRKYIPKLYSQEDLTNTKYLNKKGMKVFFIIEDFYNKKINSGKAINKTKNILRNKTLLAKIFNQEKNSHSKIYLSFLIIFNISKKLFFSKSVISLFSKAIFIFNKANPVIKTVHTR